jgi:hypothetical protein
MIEFPPRQDYHGVLRLDNLSWGYCVGRLPILRRYLRFGFEDGTRLAGQMISVQKAVGRVRPVSLALLRFAQRLGGPDLPQRFRRGPQ